MPQQSIVPASAAVTADLEAQIDAMIRMAGYLSDEARGVCPIAAALLQLAYAELLATRAIQRGEIYAMEIRQRSPN